jgi:hypothetical protein
MRERYDNRRPATKNASPHDRIEQVLAMRPTLHEAAKALSQNSHVEMGKPVLEHHRNKASARGGAG